VQALSSEVVVRRRLCGEQIACKRMFLKMCNGLPDVFEKQVSHVAGEID
jgi:hypothetical protein